MRTFLYILTGFGVMYAAIDITDQFSSLWHIEQCKLYLYWVVPLLFQLGFGIVLIAVGMVFADRIYNERNARVRRRNRDTEGVGKRDDLC